MKKNGFVFIETIVVMSALSLTLILLFSSYSYILNKTRQRNTFDTVEGMYKIYYIEKLIKDISSDKVGEYIENNCIRMFGSSDCKVGEGNACSYVCDLTADSGDANYAPLFQAKYALEADKIYYVNTYDINSYTFNQNGKIRKGCSTADGLCNDWILKFDATTIDYIKSKGKIIPQSKSIMIVKFKKRYRKKGNYEVFHASNAELVAK